MKKYNLSKIMKEAWKTYKKFQKCVKAYQLSFSECLRRAWKTAKEELKVTEIMNKYNFCYMEIGMARVHVNLGDCIISGNTYGCKETLKAYGLKYNGYEKYWEGSRENIAELIKVYA